MSQVSKALASSPSQLKERKAKLNNLLDSFKEKPWWRLETGLLAGAIACGILSGLLSHFNSNQQERYYQEAYATKAVLITTKQLAQGEVITRDHMQQTQMLRMNVTQNHLTADGIPMVLGKQVTVDLKKGDPLLLSAIQGAAEITSMAQKIPAGKRLFSLSIEDPSVQNGFIKPNDHVDILAYMDLPNRGRTVFTVLQDVTLVSIGSMTNSSNAQGTSASNVSFFVSQKEAEILSYALKVGTFSLSLRNPKDISKAQEGKGIAIKEFLDYGKVHDASGGSELQVTERGRRLKAKKGGK